MKSAARQNGVNLVVGNSNSKINKEQRLIQNYIKLGVDAIVISPVAPEKSIPALKLAHEKGIKIILYNNSLKADFPISNVASSQNQLG